MKGAAEGAARSQRSDKQRARALQVRRQRFPFWVAPFPFCPWGRRGDPQHCGLAKEGCCHGTWPTLRDDDVVGSRHTLRAEPRVPVEVSKVRQVRVELLSARATSLRLQRDHFRRGGW